MKKILFFCAIFTSQSLIAQNVGIGITTPLVPLHISTGASGNITPFSPLVVEGNNNTYINLLTPNNKETGLLFGKADNAASGGIVYNNVSTPNGFQFRTAGNITQMILNNTGNLGIGIVSPDASALLHVDLGTSSTKGVLVKGTFGVTATVPDLSLGSRLMFYPGKAVFRAGFVDGAQWDNVNTGAYSIATGKNTLASNESSVAMGNNTEASGAYSVAMGNGTRAIHTSSTAMGDNTIATEFASTAFGSNAHAFGYISTAIGLNTTAFADAALATGSGTLADQNFSTAMGLNSQAKAYASFAVGQSVIANSFNSISMGSFNEPIVGSYTQTWVPTEPLLILGNGTSSNDKKNALVILKNGNTGIGMNSPNAPLAFSNTTGPKISLYEGSVNSQYGFAVQNSQLQIYSDNAAAKISFGYYSSGTYVERMYLTNTTGSLTVAGSYYFSDARYKKQITRLQNPLEKIMAINGVEYFMRTDEFPTKQFNDKLQVGLIAQEVEKILPQVVQTGEDGYKAIDYAKIVPLLVEGIKEQQKQIDELRRIVENLRKQ